MTQDAAGPYNARAEGVVEEAAVLLDAVDNDGDDLVDHPADPGCDSPEDDDERNADGPAIEQDVGTNLPRTGSDSTVALTATAGLAAAALVLRRLLAARAT